MKKILLMVLLFITTSPAFCQIINFIGKPELFAPGVISAENSEIKITFSKDGNLVLWGRVNKEGDFDILQSEKTDTGWSVPQRVSFNSGVNDFDPCFSADGKIVYFFSNRPGGLGGDDIYYVKYDATAGIFGEPVNMGAKFNTTGDEWGPAESIDGNKFLFCTDGLKGKGDHDIYICERTPEGWGVIVNIDKINSVGDDFDPVLLHDNKTIIFTRKMSDDEAFLYTSSLLKEGYSDPVKISEKMNIAGAWNLGTSIDRADSTYIYYSTRINDNSKGRMDIYRIKYSITADDK